MGKTFHKYRGKGGYKNGYITFKNSGDFVKTREFFDRTKSIDYRQALAQLGEEGVQALASATPKDTGKTAASWSYTITRVEGKIHITWTNSNVNHYVHIALLIQYGHGTGTGGYVQGIDYINPAIRPIFEAIADRAWKEVTKG